MRAVQQAATLTGGLMARVDVKVVLLGQQSVGKSCLLDRYITGYFEGHPKNTIGAAFAAKKVKVQSGREISLGIWDTAGAERFQSISRMYYHGSKAAVVCFSPSSQQSFAKAKFWVQEVSQNEPECKVYFALTKCDLLEQAPAVGNASLQPSPSPQESATPDSGKGSFSSEEAITLSQQEVSDEDISAYAQEHQAQVFSTSAKTGIGVRGLFTTIAEDLAASAGQEPHPQHAHRHTARPRTPTTMNNRLGTRPSSPDGSTHNSTLSRLHRKHWPRCCSC